MIPCACNLHLGCRCPGSSRSAGLHFAVAEPAESSTIHPETGLRNPLFANGVDRCYSVTCMVCLRAPPALLSGGAGTFFLSAGTDRESTRAHTKAW